MTLIGQEAKDYFNHLGMIVDFSTVKNYTRLKQYDSSGWLNPIDMECLDLSPNTILVAFEDYETGETNVFTLDEDGVQLLIVTNKFAHM